MSTFVLISGSWLGGWAWHSVTPRLRAEGHAVYPVTLTGLGERVHLGGPAIDLETHITDVVNVLAYEDLRGVVLVGHSYAGIVITGVADRVPERIGRLVYVDSAPLPSGVAQAEFFPSPLREEFQRRVTEEGDGWRLPLPSWEELDDGSSLEGLDERARALMRARATDMPYNAALQPLRLGNPARERLPKTAVWCTLTAAQVREMMASGAPLFSELTGPVWTFLELPTGHWPMFSRPEALAEVLLTCAP